MNTIDSYLRARDYSSSAINSSSFSAPEGKAKPKPFGQSEDSTANEPLQNGRASPAAYYSDYKPTTSLKPVHTESQDASVYSPFQNDEDWITKKRVETVTTKSQERRLHKQVVLEDGRVISESAPEVTVDTVEDRQSHEEDASDDRTVGYDGDFLPTASAKGLDGTILGERFERTVNTRDVQSSSVTTAAGQNLGEITATNVDKVIQHGRDVKSLVKAYEDDNAKALAIVPAKVVHRDNRRHKTVDKEDVTEISRMHQGKIKTDKFVSREHTEDRGDASPDSGSSTESESHSADAHAFTQRKEDRYIDYYKVPRGRPASEGKLLRKGIHLSSHDKESRRVEPWSSRARHHALAYDDQSDSTQDGRSSRRPPNRPERSTRSHHRGSGGGGGSSNSNSSFPITRAAPPPTLNRGYHTIERSQKVGSEKNKYYRRSYTPIGDSHQQQHHMSPESGSQYRSRSMSRSSGHRGSGTFRSDLDAERTSRLKRAMSFSSSTKSFGVGSRDRERDSRSQSKGNSFLGSMKSLYASITRGTKRPSPKRHSSTSLASRSATPNEWFDHPQSRSRPSAPPRKHRSTSNLGGSSVYSDHSQPGRTRNWSAYSGSGSEVKQSRPNSSYYPGPRAVSSQEENLSPNVGAATYANPRRREKESKSNRNVERRKTISSYDDLGTNREPPRFESRNRSSSRGRFFGEEGFGDDSEVVRRQSRPAPDMRKLLLSHVNDSRRHSMTRDPETRDAATHCQIN